LIQTSPHRGSRHGVAVDGDQSHRDHALRHAICCD
jgi:hypothetical protein